MKNRVVDFGRSFSCDFPVGERTDPNLTVQTRVLFFSNRAVGTMQVRDDTSSTILSCLYYDSSNCVSSILCFFVS